MDRFWDYRFYCIDFSRSWFVGPQETVQSNPDCIDPLFRLASNRPDHATIDHLKRNSHQDLYYCIPGKRIEKGKGS